MDTQELIDTLGDKLYGLTRGAGQGKWMALPVYKGHEAKGTVREALQQLYDTTFGN